MTYRNEDVVILGPRNTTFEPKNQESTKIHQKLVLRFTCGERIIWENIKISQNIMKMTVCEILFCSSFLY